HSADTRFTNSNSERMPFAHQCPSLCNQHKAVLNSDPEEANKPHQRRHVPAFPGNEKGDDAADQGHWYGREDQACLSNRSQCGVYEDEHRDEPDRSGDNRVLRGACLALAPPPEVHKVASGQLNFAYNTISKFGRRASEITARDRGFDRNSAASCFAPNGTR